MKFPHFIRSQKRRGGSGLRDNNMQWDFWSLNPESAHQVTYLMGDRGIPKSYRHMNGYGSHTYLWVNAAGEKHWVKYHFHSNQGVEGLSRRRRHPHRRRGRRLPPPRPVRLHRGRRAPVVDAVDPGDALRGREDLPVQPVRPHQGVAAQRLPAHRGRHDDPQPQPGELLRRDRAGGLRAVGHRARHRLLPRQDAARAGLRLLRHPPLPHRPQLPAAAGQPAPGGDQHLHPGRADGLRAPRRRPGLRAQLLRPRLRRRGRRGERRLGGRRRDGAPGLRAARGRRRLRPGRHPRPRGVGRRDPRQLRQDRRRSPARRGRGRRPRARLRLLEGRRRRLRQADRGARAGRWPQRQPRRPAGRRAGRRVGPRRGERHPRVAADRRPHQPDHEGSRTPSGAPRAVPDRPGATARYRARHGA